MTKSIRSVLKPKRKFTVNGRVWMECNGERFFGPGPAELLEGVAETGSISKAAKGMDMSYKKAWKIVDRLNGAATVPLVTTSPGGKHGGGSVVSEEAKELMRSYCNMREAFKAFLAQQSSFFNNR